MNSQRILLGQSRKVSHYHYRGEVLLFTKRDRQNSEKTRDLIDYVAGKIIRGKFQPKESKACQWCDYKEYCLSKKDKPIRGLERKRITQLVFPL